MENLLGFSTEDVGMIIGLLVLAATIGFIPYAIFRFVQEHRAEKKREARPRGHSVHAKIMDPILPMGRGEKYERPLDQALEACGLGMVTGGGTQVDENGGVAWVELDIELSNLDEALEFTRQKLRELGAPPGSVLQYRIGENPRIAQIT